MEFMPKGNLCDLLHSGADIPYTFILKVPIWKKAENVFFPFIICSSGM